MHPDIRKLLAVQKVDSELARIQRDLDSLPREEAKRARELEQARQASAAAKQELTAVTIRSRESENSIRGADEEIRKLESRLNSVKNNAEYQATLFQIESVRRERNALEEEGLALLDKVEGLREVARETDEKLAAEEATFAKFQNEAAALAREREAARQRVSAGRAALIEGIPPDLLAKYSTLFAVRGGVAVCAVEGDVCTGCYTSITPNDQARLLGASSIVQCGSCQRMLYFPET